MSDFDSSKSFTVYGVSGHIIRISNDGTSYAIEKVTKDTEDGDVQTIRGGETVNGSLNTGLKRGTNSNKVYFNVSFVSGHPETEPDYYVHAKQVRYLVTAQTDSGYEDIGTVTVTPSSASTEGIVETSGTATINVSVKEPCTFSNWHGGSGLSHVSDTTSTNPTVTGVDDGDVDIYATFNCISSITDITEQMVKNGVEKWFDISPLYTPEEKTYVHNEYLSDIRDVDSLAIAFSDCDKPFLKVYSAWYEEVAPIQTVFYSFKYILRGDKGLLITKPDGSYFNIEPNTNNTVLLTDCDTAVHVNNIYWGINDGYNYLGTGASATLPFDIDTMSGIRSTDILNGIMPQWVVLDNTFFLNNACGCLENVSFGYGENCVEVQENVGHQNLSDPEHFIDLDGNVIDPRTGEYDFYLLHDNNYGPLVHDIYVWDSNETPPCYRNDGASGATAWYELDGVNEGTVYETISGSENFLRYFGDNTGIINNKVISLEGRYISETDPEYIWVCNENSAQDTKKLYKKKFETRTFVKKWNGEKIDGDEITLINPTDQLIRYNDLSCGGFNGWYYLDEHGEREYLEGESLEISNPDSCCTRFFADVKPCNSDYGVFGVFNELTPYRPAFVKVPSPTTEPTIAFNSKDVIYENIGLCSVDDDVCFELEKNIVLYADDLLVFEEVSGSPYGNYRHNPNNDRELVKITNTIIEPSSLKLVDKFESGLNDSSFYRLCWISIGNTYTFDNDVIVYDVNALKTMVDNNAMYFCNLAHKETYNGKTYYNKLIYQATCSVNKSAHILSCGPDENTEKMWVPNIPLSYMRPTFNDFSSRITEETQYVDYGTYENVRPYLTNRYFKNYVDTGIQNINSPYFKTSRDGNTIVFEPNNNGVVLPQQGHVKYIHNNDLVTLSRPYLVYNDGNISTLNVYTKDYVSIYNSEHYKWDSINKTFVPATTTGSGISLYTYSLKKVRLGGYQVMELTMEDALYSYKDLFEIKKCSDLQYALDNDIRYVNVTESIDYDMLHFQVGVYKFAISNSSVDQSYEELPPSGTQIRGIDIRGNVNSGVINNDINISNEYEIEREMNRGSFLIHIKDSLYLTNEHVNKVFYCDRYGVNAHGEFVTILTNNDNNEFNYINVTNNICNFYKVQNSVSVDSVQRLYEISSDGSFILIEYGIFYNNVFYENNRWYSLNNRNVTNNVINNIIDNITIEEDAGTEAGEVRLTAPSTNGIYIYDYIKITGTPSVFVEVNDYNEYLTARDVNHSSYIKIRTSFFNPNNGIKYLSGEYYQLKRSSTYNVTSPSDGNTYNLPFIGWMVESGQKFEYYCDRSCRSHFGQVEYPIPNNFKYIGNTVSLTGNSQLDTPYEIEDSFPHYIQDSTTQNYVNVFSYNELVNAVTEFKNINVLTETDVFYGENVFEKNNKYTCLSHNSNIPNAFSLKCGLLKIQNRAYNRFCDGKLFYNDSYYINEGRQHMVLTNDDVVTKISEGMEYCFIGDYVLVNEIPSDYIIVSTLTDLKYAISTKVEYIKVTSDLYYNYLFYGNDSYYKFNIITIDGVKYNPGDVLRLKTDRSFIRSNDIMALPCETCTAIYAYDFKISVITSYIDSGSCAYNQYNICNNDPEYFGLGFNYDGVRLNSLESGIKYALFDERHLINNHILYPSVPIDNNLSYNCLNVNGWESKKIGELIKCMSTDINDVPNWVDGVFKGCAIYGLYTSCNNTITLDDYSLLYFTNEYNVVNVTINQYQSEYTRYWFENIEQIPGIPISDYYKVTTNGQYYGKYYLWDGSSYVEVTWEDINNFQYLDNGGNYYVWDENNECYVVSQQPPAEDFSLYHTAGTTSSYYNPNAIPMWMHRKFQRGLFRVSFESRSLVKAIIDQNVEPYTYNWLVGITQTVGVPKQIMYLCDDNNYYFWNGKKYVFSEEFYFVSTRQHLEEALLSMMPMILVNGNSVGLTKDRWYRIIYDRVLTCDPDIYNDGNEKLHYLLLTYSQTPKLNVTHESYFDYYYNGNDNYTLLDESCFSDTFKLKEGTITRQLSEPIVTITDLGYGIRVEVTSQDTCNPNLIVDRVPYYGPFITETNEIRTYATMNGFIDSNEVNVGTGFNGKARIFYTTTDQTLITTQQDRQEILNDGIYGTLIYRNNITNITYKDVSSNEKMNTVTLPYTVQSIGAGSFKRCISLEKITLITDVVPQIEPDSFDGIINSITIELNDRIRTDFEADRDWTRYVFNNPNYTIVWV